MKLKIAQRSDEWLKLRKTKIGASDIPAIMGESPWYSPLDIWEIKMDMKEPFINEAMRHGIENEKKALRMVEEKLNLHLTDAVFIHDEYDFALASLDGLSYHEDVIVEIKAPKKCSHNKFKSSGVPVYYQQQMQWQMFVTGIKQAVFASWYEGDLFLKEVRYDESIIEALLLKAKEFYYQNMLKKIAPIIQSSSYIEIEDSELYSLEEIYLKLDEQEAEIKREKEKIRSLILEFSSGLQVKGKYLQVTNATRKGSIDETKIASLGFDLTTVRKPSTFYQVISKIR